MEKVEGEPCRLCDEVQEAMHSVFETGEDGKEIMQLIKENIPIILYKNDPLSKQICQSCLENLSNLSSFKKVCKETQERQKVKLRATEDAENPEVRLFLGSGMDIPDEVDELKDASTGTEDFTIHCNNCKQAVLDACTVNGELELCIDLHKVIEESLQKNKVDSESEKVLRKRKIQPLYHELDDSLCSSLTEFTQNTDNSHCGFEDGSDMDSVDSESEMPKRAKRRKIAETTIVNNVENEIEEKETEEVAEKIDEQPEVNMEEIFMQESDYRYQPLTLLQLTLNLINMQNIPDYMPLHYIEESTECECKCGQKFKNWKLLALHEPSHMEIEVGEKIDNPKPWPEDYTDSDIRNKWLNFFDENGYDENDIVVDTVTAPNPPEENPSNLLVVNKETETKTHPDGKVDEIVLVGNKAMVNGIALSDYTKEERKAFYQSLRIGGLTKKFCTLCRYCFKDNWAIESHYFSSACFYTCRFCGVRFNKQRHKYDEHIKEHEERNDPKSDKIYAASKVNNFLPKVIHPQRVRTQAQLKEEEQRQKEEEAARELMRPQYNYHHGIKVRNLERRSLPADIKIKQEPNDDQLDQKDIITSQSKTGNQAYFCRKCYKVFFKLDEYNFHSQKCSDNQLPSTFRQVMVAVSPNQRSSLPSNVPKPVHTLTPERARNGESGRPIRNCVRDIGPYKDEVYIPESLLKETVSSGNPQAFVCHICNTPFPTIYSRNSHMRIHKGEMGGMPPIARPRQIMQSYNYEKMMSETAIKQEPLDTSMEPMVEIHEEEQPSNVIPSSLGGGAVSLTPISKNPNHKPTINPNIMRLVQNNPNITISKGGSAANGGGSYNHQTGSSNILNLINAQAQNHHNQQAAGGSNYPQGMVSPQEDKSYKCSSCWEAFANKSHLYFHKKNQCEGSRFPCPFCKKRFGTEAAYSSHIFYSHPE